MAGIIQLAHQLKLASTVVIKVSKGLVIFDLSSEWSSPKMYVLDNSLASECLTSSKFSVASPPACSLRLLPHQDGPPKIWSNHTACGAGPASCSGCGASGSLPGCSTASPVWLLRHFRLQQVSGPADTSRAGQSRAPGLNEPGPGHSLHPGPTQPPTFHTAGPGSRAGQPGGPTELTPFVFTIVLLFNAIHLFSIIIR